ncbi:MAG TPA: HPF/RaiA family ribosome-associated protein [Methylomirabilota bacterium]|nr:HPF/RaiA family ribosome-associated protein [Methylomirabilota bacterium]
MTLTVEGANHDAALRGVIQRKLGSLESRRRVKAVSARVGFRDENGPKGGVDIRCALTLELPRRPTLHVEDVAGTHRGAFDAAFESLERRLERELQQGRDRRRRPKKYYVAKRLLAPDAETPFEP